MCTSYYVPDIATYGLHNHITVGCLNKHCSNKDDADEDYPTSNSQRQKSDVNKQPLQYTDNTHVYDRTSHDPI